MIPVPLLVCVMAAWCAVYLADTLLRVIMSPKSFFIDSVNVRIMIQGCTFSLVQSNTFRRTGVVRLMTPQRKWVSLKCDV